VLGFLSFSLRLPPDLGLARLACRHPARRSPVAGGEEPKDAAQHRGSSAGIKRALVALRAGVAAARLVVRMGVGKAALQQRPADDCSPLR
jgi:hypothetical protein